MVADALVPGVAMVSAAILWNIKRMGMFLSTLGWIDNLQWFSVKEWYKGKSIVSFPQKKSFGPSDAKWWKKTGSTLAQVMAFAWRHQAITWTNIDFSSLTSNDIHIRTISQEIPQPSIAKIRLKITYLKFYWNFPGANELKVEISKWLIQVIPLL